MVAAAADLKFALDDVVADFRKVHPELDVKVTYGSSGALYSQIDNGAPF
jgi:molybdate transport system substrate-binding protein